MKTEGASSARTAALVAAGAAGGAALGGAVSMGTATYFAHRIITPEHEKKDDVTIVSVDEAAGTADVDLTVTLADGTVTVTGQATVDCSPTEPHPKEAP